jgi:hypothetical protein
VSDSTKNRLPASELASDYVPAELLGIDILDKISSRAKGRVVRIASVYSQGITEFFISIQACERHKGNVLSFRATAPCLLQLPLVREKDYVHFSYAERPYGIGALESLEIDYEKSRL